MKLLSTDDGKTTMILLETRQEGQDMVTMMEAAQKSLHKASRAMKLAKEIENHLPVF